MYNPAMQMPPTMPTPILSPMAAPQPRPRRTRRGRIIVVALVILLLALVGELGYFFLVVQPGANTASPSGSTAPNSATVQAEATDIATAPGALYSRATSGNPTIQDSLNSSSASTWTAYSGNNGRCAFTGGMYHINSLSAGLTACFFKERNFDDFAFQVQMTITKGDAGGITFRFPSPGTTASSLNAYVFIVNVLGQCSLIRIHNGDYTPLVTKSSPTIGKGVNQTALLTVIARGSAFFLYVNRQFITTVQDKTFQSGLVGLLSLSFQDPTEVAFHNAQIWA